MDIAKLWALREQVRQNNPLVYNITNNVVTNFTANVLLAAGASPIMSEGQQEADDLVKIASVLVLNIGTLHQRQIDYCLAAGTSANKHGVPVIFDPVGVGASVFRNNTAAKILETVNPALIRGNYGEISFLAGTAGQVKGVDSGETDLNTEAAKLLATRTGALVAATGAIDYITDGYKLLCNSSGDAMLQLVTGTGCALSSLAGAFLAVAADRLDGVLAAIAFYGAAAEKAVRSSQGPGSFALNFLDAIYALDEAEFTAIIKTKL
jgi:hydroxyethylthiazole kinase